RTKRKSGPLCRAYRVSNAAASPPAYASMSCSSGTGMPPILRVRRERRRERIRIAPHERLLQHALRHQVAIAVVVDRDRLRWRVARALERHPLHARFLAAPVPGAERRARRGSGRPLRGRAVGARLLRELRRALILAVVLALGLGSIARVGLRAVRR